MRPADDDRRAVSFRVRATARFISPGSEKTNPMKNYLQKGDALDAVAPVGGFVAGLFYLLGSIGGVAALTVAQGEKSPIHRKGVFSLPKATGTAWSFGDQLYWDATASKFTKTSVGNTAFGKAAADALSAAAVGSVAISPSNT
jgi:predicted RecA/RadA family phage recombinase